MFLPSLMGFDFAKDAFVGLLDLYPNAAAAYSVRKLRTLYTGSAIRVRNSSNSELDIGFTATGNLDTTALLSHCGAGNGFVTTWYDQSGNANNATQTTAANQPQIVSSGSVILQGSKPTLKFDGNNDILEASGVTTGNPKSIFIPTKFSSIDSTERVLFDSITTDQALLFKAASNAICIGFGSVVTTSYNATTNYILYSILHDGSTSNAYVNSTNQFLTNTNLGTNAFNGLRIGAVRGTASLFYNGIISEFVIYGSNESSNRTGIESNINTYYGIY